MNAKIVEDLIPLAKPEGDFNLDPSNARKHDDRNVDFIATSLDRSEQRKPIVVQQKGMIVRAGNGTLMAARKLGWTHIAAVVVDESDVEAAIFAIADNRSAELATWDNSVLHQTYQSLGVQPEEIGFLPDEMESISEMAFEGVAGGGEGDIGGYDPESDTFFVKVEGVKRGQVDTVLKDVARVAQKFGYTAKADARFYEEGAA